MTVQEELSKVVDVRCNYSFLDDYKEDEHHKQCFDATRSKFVELGNFYVVDEDPGSDEFYAICITFKGKRTTIEIDARDHEDGPTRYNFPNNSIMMAVNNINIRLIEGSYEISKFKVVEKPIFGKGKSLYRAEITFSDTYFVHVFADSEQEAIEQAYKIDMPTWQHDWPIDPELDRHQVTRVSKWGKKMIRAKEYHE